MLRVMTKIHLSHDYRPQRSIGQVYVFACVCDSVHRGGGSASLHTGIPPRADIPRSRHSSRADTPREQTPPRADTPWE